MNSRQYRNRQTSGRKPTLIPAVRKPSSFTRACSLKLCLGLALAGWQWQACGGGKNWIGGAPGAANDWNTAANWNPVGVPASGDDATLGKNATAYPILSTAASSVIRNLNINAGATMTILPGGSLMTSAGAASVAVNGTLIMSGGMLVAYQDVNGSGTISMSGGVFKIGHDWHLDASQFSATGGTVEWTGQVGNAGPGGFPGGSGSYQFFNVLVDAGVDPGFDNQANNFTIMGNWTNNGAASLNQKATTVSFIGASAQVIAGSVMTTFDNLAINNPGGVTLSATASVNGTLTLTQGLLSTGANSIDLTASAVVYRASSSSYVNGNITKAFKAGNNQSFSFPVGDGATFAPIVLASLNITTAGSLTASTAPGQHPCIMSSGINPYRDAARYWSLTNAPAGIRISSGTATFNFAASDVCANAVPTNFVAKRYAGNWSNTTSTASATSASVSGLTSFGDFAVGQIGSGPPTVTYCSVQADRSALIGLAGVPGVTYTIHASVDLANWTAIGTTVAGTNGAGVFQDTVAEGMPVRFYRASYP